MEIRFSGNVDIKGRLWVEDDLVRVIPKDGPPQEFTREDVISVTIGSPKEIDHWAMKVSIGANVRTGNTDVTELNMSARFLRRSVKSRLTIDYIGNYNETDELLQSNNHRASFGWDKFVNQRFFWNPVFAEYYRDPFQNIAHRVTIGIGAGYQVIDGKKTEWSLSGGPGYQENRFDDVLPGEPEKETTPAIVFSSSSDMELTGWMDFITEYRIQITNEESGTFNHHMVIAFETEITSLLDFDVQWIWDRIQDPRQNSDGTFPEQDDFRTVIAFGFDW